MAKVVNTFTKGKLNKDLDARLVPNGEYRDARNVQVSKSEGPDVGELENVLNTLSKLNYSQIFFVPAVKINFYLKIMKKHYFDRKIMIAKEITKIYEEFFRDSIKEI